MNPVVNFSSEQLLEVAHIALAMLLGGILGIERELARKPAGLRTHMLVAGSAALLVALGDVVIAHYNAPGFIPATRIVAIGATVLVVLTLRLVGELESRFRGD